MPTETKFEELDTEGKMTIVAASALTALCAGLADNDDALGADMLVTAWRARDLERLVGMLHALAETYRPGQPAGLAH